MLADTQDARTLINEAAFMIIQEQAPEELPLYTGIRDRYLADPAKFGQQPKNEDEPLGFGASAAVELFSHVVFVVLPPLLELLLNETAKSIGKEVGTNAFALVHSLFNRTAAKSLPLTAQQLATINQAFDRIAEEEARRLNLRKAEVQRVRDAVIRRLAVSPV